MLGLGNNFSRGGVLSGLTNNYSLDFDGTDDYVDVGTAYNGVKSISFFIKADDVTSNTDYVLGLNNSDYISVVNGTVTLTGFSGGTNTIYVDGSEASIIDTDWHHVLITSTTARNASNCDLGRTQSNNSYNMLGNLDEIAFTSDVKSASDFADGTTPIDISSLSNLQNWWRMGDGTLDDGNIAGNGLIGDQNSPTLGSELVANGDDDSTLPTINSQALEYYNSSGALSNEQAYSGTKSLKVSCTSTGGNDSKVRFADGSDCGLTSGTLYKMSVWVYIPSGQGALDGLVLRYKPNGGSNTTVNSTTTTDTWVNLIGYFIDNDVTRFFEVRTPADTDGDYFYVDIWSVKAVNGNPGLMVNFDGSDIVTDTP